MDTLKKIWFYSFKAKSGAKDLVIPIVVYVVVLIVASILLSILGRIPFVGILTGIIGWALDLYCTAGIVFAILNFLKVGPFAD